MQLLSKKTLRLVKESLKTRNRLAYVLDKSADTIDRYVEKNSPLLTSASALTVISEELGIKEEEILTQD